MSAATFPRDNTSIVEYVWEVVVTDWVVPGLHKKRAEISGKIIAYERDIGQLRADLRNIDAVLRLFGFDYRFVFFSPATCRTWSFRKLTPE